MNSLPDLNLLTNDPQGQQISSEERLEDYLEHLIAPLIGLVPYTERKAFRQEAHAHLDGLIREYRWQGQDLQAATETALREFGEPWKVGQTFLQEWLQGTPDLRPPMLIRKATCVAFAWFGMASMLTLLALEQHLLAPANYTLLPGIGLMAFFAPFVAGCLTGAMSPAHAQRGTRNAFVILILHSLTAGLLLQPRMEGLAFAAWQLLFWLPAGRISASVTVICLRYVRRQRFWQAAR